MRWVFFNHKLSKRIVFEDEIYIYSSFANIIIAVMLIRNPQNIKIVGISKYKINPKIKAAKGSTPDNNMEDVPESI